MKHLIIQLAFIIASGAITAQEGRDLEDIVQGAQLLTVDLFTLKPLDSLISEVLTQETTHITTEQIPGTHFIKIKYDQKREFYQFEDCYFLVAFDEDQDRYYRIGGFAENDACEFLEEVFYVKAKVPFDFKETEIDFSCLEEYNNMNARKKRKKGYCYPKVAECVAYKVIIH